MHPHTTSHVVWAGLLVAVVASATQAQELAGSFQQLRVLVKPGDTVSVTDRTGRATTGTIAELSSSSLALTVAGTRRSFLESDIGAIRQRRADPLANGAKWGFVVGAGLGVVAGLGLSSEYGDGAVVMIPMLALVYGGMGAGAGAGIDALKSSNQVIFARGGSSSKASVRPLLARGRRGALASLTF